MQIYIERNRELIKTIRREIDNGTYKQATTFAEWVRLVQSGDRSYGSDSNSTPRREPNRRVDELYDEEPRSESRKDSEQGSGNSQGVKLTVDSKIRENRKNSIDNKANKWKNYVGNYTSEERASILRSPKNIIANSVQDICNFIENIPKNSVSLFVGKIDISVVNRIKKITNLSTDSLSLVLHSDEIRHIIKHHGNVEAEQQRGQIAIAPDNIDIVIKTVMAPNTVEKSTDSSGTISLVFKKEINGKVSAITVLSQKKKALTLKSAWIIKEKQHISPPSDVQAPNQTPNSELSMNAVSNNSISQNEEKSTHFKRAFIYGQKEPTQGIAQVQYESDINVNSSTNRIPENQRKSRASAEKVSYKISVNQKILFKI